MLNTFVICSSAFLLCLLGFWLAWAFMSAPPEENDSYAWSVQNLPFFYQWGWFYRLIFTLSHSLGMYFMRLCPKDMLEWLTRQLKAAGVKLSVQMFMTSQFIFAASILPVYFLYIFAVQNWILAPVAFMISLLLWGWPLCMVYIKAQKRQQGIIRTLPFAIDLIGAAMRSGQSFMAAVRFYVHDEDATNPLVQEFSQVLQDMSGGKSQEDALISMADRVQLETFTIFVSAIVNGNKVGASIVQTLKNQGGMLRRERFALAQQKAEMAKELIPIPLVLFLVPAFLLIIGFPMYKTFMKSFAGI